MVIKIIVQCISATVPRSLAGQPVDDMLMSVKTEKPSSLEATTVKGVAPF